MNVDEIEKILGCLGSEIKNFKKDEIILSAGDKPVNVGVVMTGRIHIVREDIDGNRMILSAAAPGEIFAEAMCCAGVTESPVTVISETDSSVLFINISRLLRTCQSSCVFHAKLIENMLGIIANKNLHLQSRIEILSLKSVRARATRYLESFAAKKGKDFTIPFNRDEMADYLCVNRSALSHELMKMKKEGLIEYRKNRFILR